MERSRLILWIMVVLAAVLIVWRVGFYQPSAERMQKDVVSKKVAEPNEPSQAQAPGDANEPKIKIVADANALEGAADVNQPAVATDVNEPPVAADVNEPRKLTEAGEPNKPGEPNEPLEALNLKEVEMKNIVQKIAEWTGKVVLPTDEAMKQKLTIYAPNKLPRAKALQKIYSALHLKGYVAEHTDDTIIIKPLAEAKLGLVPTIPAGQPLALIENKSQVVQKFFKLKNYSPAQMGEVVRPLIGEHGHVSADETTSSLLLIDTVENLMRIESIIAEFDVPEAEQAVTEIFEVHHGDPSEIVQMLNMLLGASEGLTTRRSSRDRDRRGFGQRIGFSGPPRSNPSSSSPAQKGDSKSGAATSVVITAGEVPIVLIPEPRRKWIIAKASAEGIRQIGEWIKKLDKAEPVESEYEIVQLMYADPQEVENSVEDGFSELPGTEFLPNVLIEPLEQTRQVMIFGRKDLREMVKKMIQEIDIPPGQFETRHFQLKYADPDQVKASLEEMYEEEGMRTSSYRTSIYYFGGSRGSRGGPVSADMVRVISYASLKRITVIASAENMIEIAKQIAEWDQPLDVDQVKPRIIELKNVDPVQITELLTTLFTEETTGSMSFFDIYFGRTEEKKKIVGPLYGQLTFEDLPGTKKIIVISKIPEAYDVIEEFVRELDREQMAEIPKVITLNYADPEELSERLNALFNEPGTTATIRLGERGLSEYSMEEGQGQQGGGQQGGGSQQQGGTSSGEYRPWWTTARRAMDEEPISNVIGRVRFIPDRHSKSILVLAPPEFMSSIEATIKELDIPGKQVMIRAIIVEVDHSNMTSLGVQLSSNPDAFGALEENAISALNQLTHLATHGSVTPAPDTFLGATGTGTVLGTGADVFALIDFLVKKINAKILNQQTLWTKDNEEAMFFKGEKVAFLAGSTTAAAVGVTQNVEFEQVGMTLQARPSITPEKDVDMVVSVQISQLTSDIVNNQPVRSEMNTTTNMIVEDGETIMLGGILFQKDSTIEHKIPLFGDVPIAGGLFRHNEVIQANSEMLVFITPYVIDEPEDMRHETIAEMERPKEKLRDIQGELEQTMEELKQQ
jgi:general secretion pathway protein D